MPYEPRLSQHGTSRRKPPALPPSSPERPQKEPRKTPERTQSPQQPKVRRGVTRRHQAGTQVPRLRFLPLPPALTAGGTGANATSGPTRWGPEPVPAWLESADFPARVEVSAAVAVGSPTRPPARDHVAAAGSRPRAPPAGAFVRSEVPCCSLRALPLSTPLPRIGYLAQSQDSEHGCGSTGKGLRFAAAPPAIRFVQKGQQRSCNLGIGAQSPRFVLWGRGAVSPFSGTHVPNPQDTSVRSIFGPECTKPWPSRLRRLT